MWIWPRGWRRGGRCRRRSGRRCPKATRRRREERARAARGARVVDDWKKRTMTKREMRIERTNTLRTTAPVSMPTKERGRRIFRTITCSTRNRGCTTTASARRRTAPKTRTERPTGETTPYPWRRGTKRRKETSETMPTAAECTTITTPADTTATTTIDRRRPRDGIRTRNTRRRRTDTSTTRITSDSRRTCCRPARWRNCRGSTPDRTPRRRTGWTSSCCARCRTTSTRTSAGIPIRGGRARGRASESTPMPMAGTKPRCNADDTWPMPLWDTICDGSIGRCRRCWIYRRIGVRRWGISWKAGRRACTPMRLAEWEHGLWPHRLSSSWMEERGTTL
mmetsp:Transcript_9390/g.20270  ORF Transcript_9390/g.20270 Transcript_9390/m.20270 type:complete len:337 (+) Transcript_9390:518-1528(+)